MDKHNEKNADVQGWRQYLTPFANGGTKRGEFHWQILVFIPYQVLDCPGTGISFRRDFRMVNIVIQMELILSFSIQLGTHTSRLRCLLVTEESERLLNRISHIQSVLLKVTQEE